ncbi:helix-turn-helix transcriptional regulator [Kordiimonas aquimaris]|uniref:helix-turn-helix transcriptional regulator n=1 Tax=Kordiimonas aquimaris TaxID=707591 RepID=UPI00374D10DC
MRIFVNTCLGQSNAEIAHELGISIKTLEKHITNIYQKTSSSSKLGLLNTIRY